MITLIVKYKDDDEYYRWHDIDAFVDNMIDYEKTEWDIVRAKLVDGGIKTISVGVIDGWIEESNKQAEEELNHIRMERLTR